MIARPAIDAGGDVDIVQIRVHFVVRGWLGRSVCSTFFGVAAVWVGGQRVKCGGVSLCVLSGSADLKLSSVPVFHQVCNNLNAGVAAFALIPILSRASSFFKRLELCELFALSTVPIKGSRRNRGATRQGVVSEGKFVSTVGQRIHGFMSSSVGDQRDRLCVNTTCSLLKDIATLTTIY